MELHVRKAEILQELAYSVKASTLYMSSILRVDPPITDESRRLTGKVFDQI